MPKITFISDTHESAEIWKKVPQHDGILVHCGDFTKMGRGPELNGEFHQMTLFPQTEKFFIYGNHERVAENPGWPHPPELVRLHNSEWTSLDGLKFWGTPYTPEFNGWAFSYPRRSEKAESMFAMIPEGLDVLVTHGPPHGILDRAYGGTRIGCEVLSLALSKLKTPPKIHAFGHCHDAKGLFFDGRTLFINAATEPVTVEL